MVGGAVLGMVAFPIMRRFKPRWQWGKEGTMAVLATAAGMGFVMARLRAEGARSVIDESERSPVARAAAAARRASTVT